jgi:hypothetical protein
MRDDHVACVEDQRLWDIPLNMDVGRLRAEVRWIAVASDSEDEVDRLVTQRRQDAFEQARRRVEVRARGGVDGRAVGEVGQPAGSCLMANAIDDVPRRTAVAGSVSVAAWSPGGSVRK